MRIRPTATLVALFALTTLAIAKTPGDVADLVGARAPGAESEMQNRGYVNVKNNTWWMQAPIPARASTSHRASILASPK